MRKSLFAIAALLITSFTPMAAQAQSLEQVLGVIGVGSSLGYNSCSFVPKGAGQVLCQVNRAATTANSVRNVVQQQDYRTTIERNRRSQQMTALMRACEAGDEISCARGGGATQQQMKIARALMDACSAGDKFSCRRVDEMMGR